ncbi:T-cell surface antigen CD2 [Artibeus jamaicensis]|uniref:T-cell surface antigen CD2 n=1 Tax=Artibeus jamaicensis TaxID=9417 RepID=UPI00235AD722|nr:T-cell surface antigen CD2 [Artibeus jamaicensis]
MSLACKILASFLLIFILSAQGTDIIEAQGALNENITLNFPDQQPGIVDDIQWFKNGTRIARVKGGKVRDQQKEYQVLASGILAIKHLQRSDHTDFKIIIYNKAGFEIFTRTFNVKILERVSKPEISWNCTDTTLTCKVTNGTDPKLELYRGQKYIKGGQKVIQYKWTTQKNASFKCTANNAVSEETSVAELLCPEKGLDIYLIIGVCGGGILLFLFVALLILFHKRRKVHRRRHGEELEIRAHRVTSDERGQKPHQIPVSAPQNPASSQPPPPPGHRAKAHGHRPLPPGHRVQHPHQNQQQKRPLPTPGTQARQQKAPPLPRPRVQPKSPRGASENL